MGADPTLASFKGKTPLDIAKAEGHPAVVKFLEVS